MLLLRSDDSLVRAVQFSDTRYRKHVENEGRRKAHGLRSDLERWAETGEAMD